MADKDTKQSVLELIQSSKDPLSISDILGFSEIKIAERTLRRWLSTWVNEGVLIRSGNRRSTRYVSPTPKQKYPRFLEHINEERKLTILKQLRDMWTHASTAIEGNALSLSDTHFLLEEGLAVSGKPLKDHQEVVGHAKAIDIVYECLESPLTTETIFKLHKAILVEQVIDIYKPNGAWKREVNGTYAVTRDNQQVFLEYAHPNDVASLMDELIIEINRFNQLTIPLSEASKYYAKIHAGIAHIHPFWDGNGRIARLLANIPLLNSSLPPLVVPVEERRQYIQILLEYEQKTGKISKKTGVWPIMSNLQDFENFCALAYEKTKNIVSNERE